MRTMTVSNCAGMLGNEHLLRTRGFSSRQPARHHQVPHWLLSVGTGDVACPGVSFLRSVPSLARIQRAFRHQYQQPRRGRRHHTERTLPGTTRKDNQVGLFVFTGDAGYFCRH